MNILTDLKWGFKGYTSFIGVEGKTTKRFTHAFNQRLDLRESNKESDEEFAIMAYSIFQGWVLITFKESQHERLSS